MHHWFELTEEYAVSVLTGSVESACGRHSWLPSSLHTAMVFVMLLVKARPQPPQLFIFLSEKRPLSHRVFHPSAPRGRTRPTSAPTRQLLPPSPPRRCPPTPPPHQSQTGVCGGGNQSNSILIICRCTLLIDWTLLPPKHPKYLFIYWSFGLGM